MMSRRVRILLIFAILYLTYSMIMPMSQVVSGAFDALSHCMETYMGMARKLTKKPSKIRKWTLHSMAALIAAYGTYIRS